MVQTVGQSQKKFASVETDFLKHASRVSGLEYVRNEDKRRQNGNKEQSAKT